MKSTASEIKDEITEWYTYDGCFYVNYLDLIEHLKQNRIDRGGSTKETHINFDASYDGSMAAFHYSDGSCLIVSPSGMRAI